MCNTNKMIHVFTDGSCIFNGKPNCIGGYGVHFKDNVFPDISLPLVLGADGIVPTNNRAELLAILTALLVLRDTSDQCVQMYSDSKYCILMVTKYCIPDRVIPENLKNMDLLLAIRNAYHTGMKNVESFSLKFVAAHTKLNDDISCGNEMADTLAVRGTAQAIVSLGLHETLKACGKNKTYAQACAQGCKTSNKLTQAVFQLLRQVKRAIV